MLVVRSCSIKIPKRQCFMSSYSTEFCTKVNGTQQAGQWGRVIMGKVSLVLVRVPVPQWRDPTGPRQMSELQWCVCV